MTLEVQQVGNEPESLRFSSSSAAPRFSLVLQKVKGPFMFGNLKRTGLGEVHGNLENRFCSSIVKRPITNKYDPSPNRSNYRKGGLSDQ